MNVPPPEKTPLEWAVVAVGAFDDDAPAWVWELLQDYERAWVHAVPARREMRRESEREAVEA